MREMSASLEEVLC